MLHDLDNAINLPDTDMEQDDDDLNIPDEVPSQPPTPAQAPILPNAPTTPPPGPTTKPPPPMNRELCNLASDLHPNLLGPGNRQTGRESTHVMYDDLIDTMKDILPDFAFVATLESKMMEEKPKNKDESTKDLEEPKTFREAWDHQNKESREK